MNETYKHPSLMLDNLKILIDNKIIRMLKCSYDSYEEYLEYLDFIKTKRHRDLLSYFQHAYGSLLLSFDDMICCDFSYADDIHSVIMYEDKDNSVLNDTNLKEIIDITEFPESSLIECLNKKIKKINILTEKSLSVKLSSVPSESRLEFIFENGKNLVLGLDLGDLSDFAIMYNIELPGNVVVKYIIE